MDRRHLRYFVTVAEELHFVRAAQRLNMQQSPLSRAIKDLEVELGVQLFERSTRNIYITEAGTLLLDEARKILAAFDRAHDKMCRLGRDYQNTLRIGLSAGMYQPRLAQLLGQYRRSYPDIDARIVAMPATLQVEHFSDGILDVALGFSVATDGQIIAEPIWRDPVAVILPSSHSWARKPQVALAEIASEPLLLCKSNNESDSHCQINKLIRAAIDQPVVAAETVTLVETLTLVSAGYGIGFGNLAELQFIQQADIAIRALAGKKALLTTFIIFGPEHRSAPAQHFIQILRSFGGRYNHAD